MNPLTESKNTTILPVLIALAFVCFALSPHARAVCQEGCLTNFNTALGDDALVSLTTGGGNTAMGFNALLNNTTGSDNTASGLNALLNNTTGSQNTAIGWQALVSNTTGFANTAAGDGALFGNTTGSENTAIGKFALSVNTTGSNNTALGLYALLFNTSGSLNTATGGGALYSNGTGNSNTATGVGALSLNGTGSDNTANGAQALALNTTGSENTASGFHALLNNTTGKRNIAVGFRAGSDLTTGENNIDIGNSGQAAESSTIRIGNQGTHTATFIAGIAGATVPTGVAVVVNANGHLGTTTSSERYKDAIKSMDKASEAILALKPVTFRYKHDLDPDGIPQFGLVAEQVEKVNPDLVARDDQGKPYTVRYEAVNAMLLNEFLKEHRKVDEQGAEIAELKAALAKQATQIQKVSDQLATQAPAPRVAAND